MHTEKQFDLSSVNLLLAHMQSHWFSNQTKSHPVRHRVLNSKCTLETTSDHPINCALDTTLTLPCQCVADNTLHRCNATASATQHKSIHHVTEIKQTRARWKQLWLTQANAHWKQLWPIQCQRIAPYFVCRTNPSATSLKLKRLMHTNPTPTCCRQTATQLQCHCVCIETKIHPSRHKS